MRIANIDGRGMILVGDRLIDIERATGGRLPSDPMEILNHLAELRNLDLSNSRWNLSGRSALWTACTRTEQDCSCSWELQ